MSAMGWVALGSTPVKGKGEEAGVGRWRDPGVRRASDCLADLTGSSGAGMRQDGLYTSTAVCHWLGGWPWAGLSTAKQEQSPESWLSSAHSTQDFWAAVLPRRIWTVHHCVHQNISPLFLGSPRAWLWFSHCILRARQKVGTQWCSYVLYTTVILGMGRIYEEVLLMYFNPPLLITILCVTSTLYNTCLYSIIYVCFIHKPKYMGSMLKHFLIVVQ